MIRNKFLNCASNTVVITLEMPSMLSRRKYRKMGRFCLWNTRELYELMSFNFEKFRDTRVSGDDSASLCIVKVDFISSYPG